MSFRDDFQQICEFSQGVLQATTQRQRACLYMSAYLYALISDHLNVTPRLVTGALTVGKRTVFSHKPLRPVLSSGNDYTGEWDGHAWVDVEGHICDLSIFWTIFSVGTPPDLQALFEQIFDGRPDYLIASRAKIEQMNVFYEENEELTGADATILMASGYRAGFISKPSQ